MSLEALVAHVTLDLDGKRIALPKHLSDRLTWLTGSDQIAAWLWTVSPGRYRLLSDGQVQVDPNLEFLRSFIVNEELIPSSEATMSKSSEEAAVVTRLVPVQLKSNKSYWRLSFPSALDELIPPNCDPKKFSRGCPARS